MHVFTVFLIEIFLFGLVIAVVGVGVFTLIGASTQADRDDARRKLTDRTPWEHLVPEKENGMKKRFRISKKFILWLIAFVISVTALVLFLVFTQSLDMFVGESPPPILDLTFS